ncbi:uncharacterized protein [Onthophagus taurus]|uniref:uncharacterized protein n=1 Tax=Onthophagus taurus TaxID=166361 RepID=UPI000C2086D3|nr:uncharacterized protein LOC111425696 [Onthophagus taurus]
MESEPEDQGQDIGKTEISLEYREYDTNYDSIEVSSIQQVSSPGVAKSKYYKQTYRTAWEHMPDFKGWLTGVQGEPTRAFCLYCQKTLHAHRLSLLKHTCTIRHQKAAQLHNTRKVKAASSPQMEQQVAFIDGNASTIQEDLEGVEYTTVEVEEQDNDGDQDNEADQDNEEMDDDEESGEAENLPVHFQKQIRSQLLPMNSTKPPISTHVLDTSKGQAVSGLQVSLYKLIDGRWTYINEGITNIDGRFGNFLDRDDFSPGRYKLHYDVDRYFEVKKQTSLYPFIEIVFDCINHTDHYHVPLLLSPYGYTTYRGT